MKIKKNYVFIILLFLLIIFWSIRYQQVNNGNNPVIIQNFEIKVGKEINTRDFSLHINKIDKNFEKDEFGNKVYLYTINLDILNNTKQDKSLFPNLYINAHLKGTNMTNGLKLNSGKMIYEFEPNKVYSGEILFKLPEQWGINTNTFTTLTYVSKSGNKILKYNLVLNR